RSMIKAMNTLGEGLDTTKASVHEEREHEREEDDFDQRSQVSRHRDRLEPEKPRITLSTFTGNNPHAWLNRVVQYFELNETEGRDRVRYAAILMEKPTCGGSGLLAYTASHTMERFRARVTHTMAATLSYQQVQMVPPVTAVAPSSSLGKKKSDSHRDNRKGKRSGNDRRGERPAAQGQNLKCPKCGRYHPGDCRFTQRVCFNCMKPGHFFSNCPEPPRQLP
ncbi:Unknown protein, partial [Striga hermonthica]